MLYYAGIGSRRLNNNELTICRKLGARFALDGYTLKTGACTGTDQAFAEGAVSAGGEVVLCLPWWSYEKEWVSLMKQSGLVTIQVLDDKDVEAHKSVSIFHPNAHNLKQGAKKLHARNYLIIDGCSFVLAWPKPNKFGLGGTGQGMKIAQAKDIKVINLNNS